MFAKLLVLLFVVALAFAMPTPDDDDDYYIIRSYNPVQFRSYIPSVATYSAPIRTFRYYDFDD